MENHIQSRQSQRKKIPGGLRLVAEGASTGRILGELDGLLEPSDFTPQEDKDSSSESHCVTSSLSRPHTNRGIGKCSSEAPPLTETKPDGVDAEHTIVEAFQPDSHLRVCAFLLLFRRAISFCGHKWQCPQSCPFAQPDSFQNHMQGLHLVVPCSKDPWLGSPWGGAKPGGGRTPPTTAPALAVTEVSVVSSELLHSLWVLLGSDELRAVGN